MLRLDWEPEARAQLRSIIEHIAGLNLAAAERLDRLFFDGLKRACRFPEIGRPGRVNGTRELIVHPNYLAIYQVTPTAIDVIRILHARQRNP